MLSQIDVCMTGSRAGVAYHSYYIQAGLYPQISPVLEFCSLIAIETLETVQYR